MNESTIKRPSRGEASESESAGPDEGSQRQCPACGGRIVHDSERGETACDDCGIVLSEDLIDRDREWRSFEDESSIEAASVHRLRSSNTTKGSVRRSAGKTEMPTVERLRDASARRCSGCAPGTSASGRRTLRNGTSDAPSVRSIAWPPRPPDERPRDGECHPSAYRRSGTAPGSIYRGGGDSKPDGAARQQGSAGASRGIRIDSLIIGQTRGAPVRR